VGARAGVAVAPPEPDRDPRLYLAAERTYLAWIRTGVALMGFGFVVARFGLFLHEIALTDARITPRTLGVSMPIGIGLIGLGVVTNLVAALRHRRYVAEIDAGRFRSGLGFGLAFAMAALLALIGLAMALNLAVL